MCLRRAIVAGDYEYDPKLEAPASDAVRVRDFLRDEAGFDYIVTLTDGEATQDRIRQFMEQTFPETLGPDDRFLFYFSGHGMTRTLDGGQRGYLVLKKSGQSRWDQLIDMPHIREWMENVGAARHVLFVLDACFSGLAAIQTAAGTVQDKTIERLMRRAHHLITAGVNRQESYSYNGASLFTSAFLAAAHGDLDPPQDGIISLGEIMVRINRQIDARRAELGDVIDMTPHEYMDRTENNIGEFFFILSRHRGAPSAESTQPESSIEKGGRTPDTSQANLGSPQGPQFSGLSPSNQNHPYIQQHPSEINPAQRLAGQKWQFDLADGPLVIEFLRGDGDRFSLSDDRYGSGGTWRPLSSFSFEMTTDTHISISGWFNQNGSGAVTGCGIVIRTPSRAVGVVANQPMHVIGCHRVG